MASLAFTHIDTFLLHEQYIHISELQIEHLVFKYLGIHLTRFPIFHPNFQWIGRFKWSCSPKLGSDNHFWARIGDWQWIPSSSRLFIIICFANFPEKPMLALLQSSSSEPENTLHSPPLTIKKCWLPMILAFHWPSLVQTDWVMLTVVDVMDKVFDHIVSEDGLCWET